MSKPVVYKGMTTPWGIADQVGIIAPGIGWVATPGHGGIHLDEDHAKRMPQAMVNASWLKMNDWYEEDCDWALPYVVFEKEILAGNDTHAIDIIKGGCHIATVKDYHNNLQEAR